ncbi:Zinc finger MYM-type protein [Arachis hypogaea]|uniref:Zinc finger MYM-type protein n=1 Tax=Arachis hypogaea TaxID=3818 RepID=A0A6B9V933_ARAHY|nr:Zinc finger MYM-type protein [Arachis hypogaea]
MIKLIASYNDEVARTVLENAPYNAKYTSHQIQKEILHILSNKVRKHICEEIGDSKFCIVVDEARDESKREQMALILRFVDIHGFIQERFLDLVHVKDTTSLTLKQELCGILSRHGLDVSNIRGQGYDGASNMRGEWNGLQALFLKDCPYAYYIHCFAHRLQLALVAASRERHDELHAAKTDEIVHLLEIDELETGKGANQIGTLKRAGDTRWSSHFSSVCSLINMYGATLTVLQKIIVDGSTYSQRGDADSAYNTLTSFEFVLILHLMKDMMGITDILCQALQKQSQDIVNAVQLVHSTKTLIQSMRDDRWEELLKNVKSFCEQHDILIPDLTASYVASYYPEDFTEQEKINLPFQLQHFILDVRQHPEMKNLSTIHELFYSYYRAIIFSNENNKDKVNLADSLVIYIEKEIAENSATGDDGAMVEFSYS